MADTRNIGSATVQGGRQGHPQPAGASTVPFYPGSGSPSRGRAVGYSPNDHAIVYSDQPVLTPEQAAVYDRLAPMVIDDILRAQEDGQSEFVLMEDWEWPDLLRGLGYRSANIVGNVRPGLLPVWSAIEALLERHGYRVVKAAQPWRLIARR